MSNRIVIDESVRELAQQYGDLVYECAVPVQRARNRAKEKL